MASFVASLSRLSRLVLFSVLFDVARAQDLIAQYAPETSLGCPSTDLVRTFSASNQSLSSEERDFVSARNDVVLDAWDDWIGNGSQLGYTSEFVRQNAPSVGIAVSGGSFRASLYGAGVLNALDARNDTAKEAGTGGLLQVSSYMSALSGGSWLMSSLYSNGFPTMHSLIFGNPEFSGWLLDYNLFFPNTDGLNVFNDQNQDFYGSIAYSVLQKTETGINTSLTDPWARALSYHFLNGTTRENFFTNDSAHGAGQLWSEIPNSEKYRNHEVPFPIILVISRPQDKEYNGTLPPEAPVYEFSPLEFASYDPSLSAAMNLKYIGSHLSDGRHVNDTACVQGLDETGFVFGTSSSLFNAIVDQATDISLDPDVLGIIRNILERVVDTVETKNDEVAHWPNPFKDVAQSTFVDTDRDWLELVDGGLNDENIPLGPMFVRSRGLDVVVAVDATANTNESFPTGQCLVSTETRILTVLNSTHQTFPPIASEQELIDAGVNMRPTFFGCNPQNDPPEYPLVIYLPNSPPLTGADPATNTGTFKLGYTPKHQEVFLDQVFNNTIGGFTPNSNSPDENFGRCLQCAAVDRARLSASPTVERSSFCSDCFGQYCFDPSNPPSKSELPNRRQEYVDPDPPLRSYFQEHKGAIIGGVVAGGVVLLLLIGAIIWFCCCHGRRKIVAKYHQVVPMRPLRH